MRSEQYKRLKARLFAEDPCCHYCRRETFVDNNNRYHPLKMSMDHKFPASLGGKSNVKNLVLACSECNKLKSDSLYEDYCRLLQGFDVTKTPSVHEHLFGLPQHRYQEMRNAIRNARRRKSISFDITKVIKQFKGKYFWRFKKPGVYDFKVITIYAV